MVQQTQSNFLGMQKIPKLMIKFCVPCVLSLLVSALYNIVTQLREFSESLPTFLIPKIIGTLHKRRFGYSLHS